MDVPYGTGDVFAIKPFQSAGGQMQVQVNSRQLQNCSFVVLAVFT